jgi:hypothetical protein
MYKYLITWIVVSIQAASCPDVIKESEFGTLNRSPITCAVYHVKEVRENKCKEFQSRDSAMSFTKRLKNYKPEGFSTSLEDKIENIKIDSLIIK